MSTPIRSVTADQYITLDRPNLDFIIEPFLPRTGFVILGGAPKAGKTYLALELAFAVAQGGTMFGVSCKQGPVVYFQFDMGEMVLKSMIANIKTKGGNTSGPMFFPHPADKFDLQDLGNPAFYNQLKGIIDANNPILIIIDVLREIHNKRENSSDDMKPLFEKLETLVAGRGCLILHHVKKTDKDTANTPLCERFRGSSYILGRVDSYWLLDQKQLMMDGRLHPFISAHGERATNGYWTFKHPPHLPPL